MKSDRIVIGIVAHVDAGKTTLAESILYLSGAIRKAGRVDHKNAFLDTHELEQQRGITIFSKQAELMLEGVPVTLLDTPGHVDFSAEMERTLQVLDYAVLVINAMDGVRGHVMTLWKLLKIYQIPVFIFINKMDQDGADKTALLSELQSQLDEGCLEFPAKPDETFYECLAMCDEHFMERYLATGQAETGDIVRLIEMRAVFPCYFGSALKMEGVSDLLEGIRTYRGSRNYPDQFGAKIYKISRDAQGSRLTHMKIIGGSLKVKMPLTGFDSNNESWEDKADQIRIYSGGSFQTVLEAGAGQICAVTGLDRSYAGAGIGIEAKAGKPLLEPVLTYRLQLPPSSDVHSMYVRMCELAEEEPQLKVIWENDADEIQVQVMGEVQLEILKSLILERYDTEVTFSAGNIVYKETVREPVRGVGHFEPLRHYAEVHLLIEPGENGSGVCYDSSCSEEMLEPNWQRQVLTHLGEKKHRGILTGSELTDVKITLTAGRGHQKHTEGGDFREATCRAVRQGLKKAENILLEPFYEFQLEVPADKAGRAMADIQRMSGTFTPPVMEGGRALINGTAPVIEMQSYPSEVAAYTRGEGRLTCIVNGYQECHNAEEVIRAAKYDPERDPANPTGSVFCSHGSGFTVPWNEIEQYIHIKEQGRQLSDDSVIRRGGYQKQSEKSSEGYAAEKELEEIFIRTYGPINRKRVFPGTKAVKPASKEKEYVYKKREALPEYLLVDGYNILFAWEELKQLAQVSMAGAKDKLCDVLSNYQGYKKNTVIVVFDAYKVDGGLGEVQQYKNIFTVYTKHVETADQYIEKTTKKMVKKHHVTVATSDALEQMIIWGMGAMRLSAAGLKEEIETVNKEIREEYLEQEKQIGTLVLPKDPPEGF